MGAPYYQDERVTIYHGDCRRILPAVTLPAATAIVTDPPYASAAATATTGRSKSVWGSSWGDMSLVELMADSTLDAAPTSEVFWFCDHLSYAALLPVFFRRYPIVQSVVWDREKLGMGAYFRRQTEFIIYARNGDAPPFVSKSARDVIRLAPSYTDREHPAQKPVELMAALITESGADTVLDPYMGSGSTLVAALREGRRAIGVEIEERYCDIAARRCSEELRLR